MPPSGKNKTDISTVEAMLSERSKREKYSKWRADQPNSPAYEGGSLPPVGDTVGAFFEMERRGRAFQDVATGGQSSERGAGDASKGESSDDAGEALQASQSEMIDSMNAMNQELISTINVSFDAIRPILIGFTGYLSKISDLIEDINDNLQVDEPPGEM